MNTSHPSFCTTNCVIIVGLLNVQSGGFWWVRFSLLLAGVLNWAPILLVALGAGWIYAGVATLFPARYFRRAYQGADLAGKKFKDDVNEGGVIGDLCTWRVQWLGVRLKNENERVFMLCSHGDFHVWKEVSK